MEVRPKHTRIAAGGTHVPMLVAETRLSSGCVEMKGGTVPDAESTISLVLQRTRTLENRSVH